jgi:hypothetical protein
LQPSRPYKTPGIGRNNDEAPGYKDSLECLSGLKPEQRAQDPMDSWLCWKEKAS